MSVPRYKRYLNACGSRRRAMKLYKANIRLSSQLYSIIGIFEIILRNSIDRHMISVKGNDWLEDAVADGGYLDTDPNCAHSYHSVQEAIHKLGTVYTHDHLVAALTFGFWTYQYGPKEFAASGSVLLNVFPARPFGTKQKDVLKKLVQINDMRNRIAHYEPICFDANTISTARVRKRYSLVIELLTWMGCTPSKLLYGIDNVDRALTAIDNI